MPHPDSTGDDTAPEGAGARGSNGRLIGVGLGLFALICLIVTFDFARGRNPRTESPLIGEILAATQANTCGRNVTAIAGRYFPAGLQREEAERRLAEVKIDRPGAWLWTPAMEMKTERTDAGIEAWRTVKTTALDHQVLHLQLSFEGARLSRVAAEVVCRFD